GSPRTLSRYFSLFTRNPSHLLYRVSLHLLHVFAELRYRQLGGTDAVLLAARAFYEADILSLKELVKHFVRILLAVYPALAGDVAEHGEVTLVLLHAPLLPALCSLHPE